MEEKEKNNQWKKNVMEEQWELYKHQRVEL